MSKPVRIREFVALQVEELAAAERRSFANTVETLLLDALEAGRYGKAGLTERGGVLPTAASADESPSHVRAPRSVSPADVAATVPGVKVASAICGVSPPGRSRPSCSLAVEHDGKHSWEA